MNILIDVAHPAHVHMFRCFAHDMIKKGNNVLFTTRDKEFEIKLLEAEGLPYVNLGRKRSGKLTRLAFNLYCIFCLFRIARRFQTDIFVSHGSVVAAYVARILCKPAIAFEDTFNMEQVKLYLPFTSVVLTSDYDHPLQLDKVIKYKGYHELLYMHPNRFQPIDRKNVCEMLGINVEDRYVLLRFVSWYATHDIGHDGMSMENKIAAVQQINQYAKVFISSEGQLPKELQSYRLPTKPEHIGHVMAHATLIFGESATMVSEAAMLGVPGIYMDNTGRYYTRDIQEKYGLCFCYTESEDDQKAAIAKAVELLSQDSQRLADEMSACSKRLLGDKIDCTAFLIWFIENYPASAEQTKIANATSDTTFWQQFK